VGLRIINPALSCLWSNCLTIVRCFPIAFLSSLLKLRILRLKCWSYIFGRFFLLLFTPWTHLIDNLGKLAADNWLWGTWIINLMDLRHESISFWFLLELDLIWVQLFFLLCMLEKPVLVKLLVLVNFFKQNQPLSHRFSLACLSLEQSWIPLHPFPFLFKQSTLSSFAHTPFLVKVSNRHSPFRPRSLWWVPLTFCLVMVYQGPQVVRSFFELS